MTRPVLIISDTHYHNFKQYAQVNKVGVNTRLWDIMRATIEASKALKAAGGNTIIHCGDVFHVRGMLAPSVLNPVVEMYRNLVADGFEVIMVAGNHDLETDIAAKVSSSVTALEGANVQVLNCVQWFSVEDQTWLFVPWVKDLADLRGIIKRWPADNLVIHAPLNGVISGIPEHGLNPNDFKGLGFKRVFCGHYHNHRRFTLDDGTDVYSVGALTHQNWGDVGSKAGYLIAHHDGSVEHHATTAPQFRKVSVADLEYKADEYFSGHYIKVIDGEFTDPGDIQKIKDDLLLRGAKAVVVEGLVRAPTTTRTISTTTAPTVQSILGEYLDRAYPGEADVKSLAFEILNRVTDD